MTTKMQECSTSCTEGQKVCLETVKFSLKKGGKYADATFLLKLIECVQSCQTCAEACLNDTPECSKVCAACAKVCEACAEACEKFPDAELKKCAEVCRRCAEGCKRAPVAA